MGELADYAADVLRDGRRTGYYSGLAETHQDLVDRIEQLERRVADYEAPIMFGELAAPLTNATRAVPDDVLTRLAAAEQRAAAAWAAVTELLATGGRVVDMEKSYDDSITEVRIEGRAGIGRWQELFTLSSESGLQSMRFAVIVPATTAPNPDLLERASVELAEAYQRAKAEEQRQAEQAAVADVGNTTCTVCKRWMDSTTRKLSLVPGKLHIDLATQCRECVPPTPSTTASVDKIAREFCAQIVENMEKQP